MHRRTRRGPLAALIGLLAALVAPAGAAIVAPAAGARPADTSIVAFDSIAGVTLGSTPARVRARLGRPSAIIRVRGRIMEFDYDRRELVVDFAIGVPGDPVDNVVADGGRYRTALGIHVGSSLAATRRAYRGMRCDVGICTLARGRPGLPGTRTLTFVVVARRVQSVQVGETFAHGNLPIMFRRT